jgi:hypothetical protein
LALQAGSSMPSMVQPGARRNEYRIEGMLV